MASSPGVTSTDEVPSGLACKASPGGKLDLRTKHRDLNAMLLDGSVHVVNADRTDNLSVLNLGFRVVDCENVGDSFAEGHLRNGSSRVPLTNRYRKAAVLYYVQLQRFNRRLRNLSAQCAAASFLAARVQVMSTPSLADSTSSVAWGSAPA